GEAGSGPAISAGGNTAGPKATTGGGAKSCARPARGPATPPPPRRRMEARRITCLCPPWFRTERKHHPKPGITRPRGFQAALRPLSLGRLQMCQEAILGRLLDHIVGGHLQWKRNCDAQRLSGFFQISWVYAGVVPCKYSPGALGRLVRHRWERGHEKALA